MTMRLIAILLITTTLPLVAQWLNYPDARTPRTKDGKPNLTALLRRGSTVSPIFPVSGRPSEPRKASLPGYLATISRSYR